MWMYQHITGGKYAHGRDHHLLVLHGGRPNGSCQQADDTHLYPSEIVTFGLLFSLKGGRFRALYRWLHANYHTWFPRLPERSRLQRLLRDHAEDVLPFLADPSFFVELIHPRRE